MDVTADVPAEELGTFCDALASEGRLDDRCFPVD